MTAAGTDAAGTDAATTAAVTAAVTAACQSALFSIEQPHSPSWAEPDPSERVWVTIDRVKWNAALAALNGQHPDAPDDWCWSALRREWFVR